MLSTVYNRFLCLLVVLVVGVGPVAQGSIVLSDESLVVPFIAVENQVTVPRSDSAEVRRAYEELTLKADFSERSWKPQVLALGFASIVAGIAVYVRRHQLSRSY